jgi:hypothetical protein
MQAAGFRPVVGMLRQYFAVSCIVNFLSNVWCTRHVPEVCSAPIVREFVHIVTCLLKAGIV